MNTGEGLHRFVDPVDGGVYLYTQFETADAKRMFACFDQPDLKARYTLTVTAPPDWKVVSNAAESDRGRPGGASCTAFATSDSHVDLPVALVAGPYAEWRDEYRRRRGAIPLGLYCRASLAQHMDHEAAVHRDQAGFRVLPPQLRRALPVRQVRPAVRARVQRRRDGERGAVTFLEDYVFRVRVTRSSTSGAPRPCCTRWRTCGSATSSPCAGGTTCG
jgi:aminopeptidase N